MKDLNTVSLIGRLTRDIEVSYSQSGYPIGKMGLANTYTVKHGESYEDATNFFDLTMFGKRVEALSQYLSKGKQVAVQGELRWSSWVNQDGGKRSKVEVVVNDIFLLGSKDDQHRGSPAQGAYHQQGRAEYRNQQRPVYGAPPRRGGPEDFEDDIPF